MINLRIYGAGDIQSSIPPHWNVLFFCALRGRASTIPLRLRNLIAFHCRLNGFADVVFSGRGLLRLAWNGRAVESAAATVLINSEVGKVCIITACGGSDMKRWLPLIAEIETYARREACKRVRIYGRKGWLRVLHGYEEKHIIMDKEVN